MSPPPRKNVHILIVHIISQGLDPAKIARVATLGCGECQVRHLQKGGGATETVVQVDPNGVGSSKPTILYQANPGENIGTTHENPMKTTESPFGKAEPCWVHFLFLLATRGPFLSCFDMLLSLCETTLTTLHVSRNFLHWLFCWWKKSCYPLVI